MLSNFKLSLGLEEEIRLDFGGHANLTTPIDFTFSNFHKQSMKPLMAVAFRKGKTVSVVDVCL